MGLSWASHSTLIYTLELILCSITNMVLFLTEVNCTSLTHWPPMRALTGCDEPWPFFLIWRHLFWPKLASSMLKFCRRRRSFQWCPDQSDWPNEAWGMHKNAQKVEQKTQTKICCHYIWLLHGKNCLSPWRFLRSFFLTVSKPCRRSITAAKRKGKAKKIPKIEKSRPKTISRFWFLHVPESKCHKTQS